MGRREESPSLPGALWTAEGDEAAEVGRRPGIRGPPCQAEKLRVHLIGSGVVLLRSQCWKDPVFQVDRFAVDQRSGPEGLGRGSGGNARWEQKQVGLTSPSGRKADGALKLGGHLR